jgi:intracellular sulfur oxidation DsrE/DsrF family protein
MMKKIAVSTAALVLMLVSGAAAQTSAPATTPAPASPKHHVIFQLSDAQGPTWDTVIRHTNNLRKAFETDGGAQVEIVFFGQGLKMLLKSNKEYEERLKKLADDGVILAACQNAMKAMKIVTEDLFPFTVQVDSGVAELTRKQEAGWAYIH